MSLAQVQLDDAKVQQLLNDPNMRRAFPFLATAHAKMNNASGGGCQGCGRKTRNSTAGLANVRKSLATMPVAQKAKLKELLNAKQVVVKYKSGRKNIKMRF